MYSNMVCEHPHKGTVHVVRITEAASYCEQAHACAVARGHTRYNACDISSILLMVYHGLMGLRREVTGA